MSAPDSLTSEEKVDQAVFDVDVLCNFAYESGFHEMGYNPVTVLRDEIKRLREYEWMYKDLQK